MHDLRWLWKRYVLWTAIGLIGFFAYCAMYVVFGRFLASPQYNELERQVWSFVNGFCAITLSIFLLGAVWLLLEYFRIDEPIPLILLFKIFAVTLGAILAMSALSLLIYMDEWRNFVFMTWQIPAGVIVIFLLFLLTDLYKLRRAKRRK